MILFKLRIIKSQLIIINAGIQTRNRLSQDAYQKKIIRPFDNIIGLYTS